MLEELGGDVFVNMIELGQLEGNREHVEAVHGHPARAVRLVERAAGRQRLAAIEHADVVESEESALENIAPGCILAVHPPGEIEQQLVEDALEKRQISGIRWFAPLLSFAVDREHAPSGPGMHRRIDVAEVPLVGGELA